MPKKVTGRHAAPAAPAAVRLIEAFRMSRAARTAQYEAWAATNTNPEGTA